MAKRRQPQSVDWLIKQIDSQLKKFGRDRHGLTLREKVVSLTKVHENFRDLGVSAVAESGIDDRNARERIRLYLIECVGTVIDSVELQVVSGIAEFARRIRELRIESGYQIASGASPDPGAGIELKPDQYLLVTAEPDPDVARRWHVANRIRRSGVGSRQRVLRFLMENAGKVVTTEELAYVAKDAKEFARRVRELRTEQGYLVATRFTGRPDLSVGQYVLQSTERVAEPHDRRIPDDVQKSVYTRDQNTCRICGWVRERWSVADPRILELHHLDQHQKGGANKAKNLAVICSKCHDEVHAGKHAKTVAKVREHLCRTSSL